MKNAIETAIDNIAVVEKENAERIVEAKAGVTAAVAEVFGVGTKVKLKDRVNGKGEEVKGAEYTVALVDGQEVIVLGKGSAKRIFHYSKLELVAAE